MAPEQHIYTKLIEAALEAVLREHEKEDEGPPQRQTFNWREAEVPYPALPGPTSGPPAETTRLALEVAGISGPDTRRPGSATLQTSDGLGILIGI